jgi:uncharacterized protein YggU (UPF0235/DUF167 family)
MKISEVQDGLILEVYVKPNSKEFKVVADGDEIVVFAEKNQPRERSTRN